MSISHHPPAENLSDNLSVSDTAYTDFKTINATRADLELTSTLEDCSLRESTVKNRLSNLKACCLKCCEVFLLVTLIAIVWLLLSLPSVFFILVEVSVSKFTCSHCICYNYIHIHIYIYIIFILCHRPD